MIWGIDDVTHEIVGTDINQHSKLVGNQELESWLRNLLTKNAEFEFQTVKMDNKDIVVLIIYKAVNQTVMFKKTDYIRIGSYTKKLSEYPSVQARLWDRLRSVRYEEQLAKQDLPLTDALKPLDYPAYFDMKQEPQPTSSDGIAHYLLEEGIIAAQENGRFGITIMGALLLARRMDDFPRIARKAVRIIQYQGSNRLHMLKEDVRIQGYAVGFEELIKYIEALIPSSDMIQGVLRTKRPPFPLLAIREIVANALIHQDFSITGAGPTIEIFSNRIEVTNPGLPLIEVRRIIDNPPRSRNEKLATLMRRLRICEELGTGWDRIVISCELDQLPAPQIDLFEDGASEGATRVTLFSDIPFSNIPPEHKLWSCYLHACIKYIEGAHLTNSSLRARFGLKDSLSGSISRLIRDAVAQGLLKPLEPNTAPRHMKYIPFWA